MKNIIITESQFKQLLRKKLNESSFPDTSVVSHPFGNNPERYHVRNLEANWNCEPGYDYSDKFIYNNSYTKSKFDLPIEFGEDSKKSRSTSSQGITFNTKYGKMTGEFSKNCALFELRPDFELSPEEACDLFRKKGLKAEVVGDNNFIRVFGWRGDKE